MDKSTLAENWQVSIRLASTSKNGVRRWRKLKILDIATYSLHKAEIETMSVELVFKVKKGDASVDLTPAEARTLHEHLGTWLKTLGKPRAPRVIKPRKPKKPRPPRGFIEETLAAAVKKTPSLVDKPKEALGAVYEAAKAKGYGGVISPMLVRALLKKLPTK